jgi:hypothetical protein
MTTVVVMLMLPAALLRKVRSKVEEYPELQMAVLLTMPVAPPLPTSMALVVMLITKPTAISVAQGAISTIGEAGEGQSPAGKSTGAV